MRAWLQSRSERFCWSLWGAGGLVGLAAFFVDGAVGLGAFIGCVALVALSCVASLERV